METLERPDTVFRFAAPVVEAIRGLTLAARGLAPFKGRSALFAACLLLIAGISSSRADTQKPNVVLIMADDMGYEIISANGGTSYQTTHIDSLARDGMRFTHAYSQPWCIPSRVKLLTGKYNWRNVIPGVGKRLKHGEQTFAHVMRRAGYATAVSGKWHMEHPYRKDSLGPEGAGFDEHLYEAKGYRFSAADLRRMKSGQGPKNRYWSPPSLRKNGKYVPTTVNDYGPDMFADFAVDFITRNKEGPFFLYYPMVLPHSPWLPTPHSAGLTDETKFKGDTKYFADMVAYADHLVGRLVRTLDDLGIAEDTLLLFTADNGTSRHIYSRFGQRVIRGDKGRTTDGGTRVPLFARWPGTVAAGRVNDDLINFSDFFATLADLAGQTLPDQVDGRSFLPQLRSQAANPAQWLFMHYAKNLPPIRFARTKRFKLYDDGRFFDVPSDWEEQRPMLSLTPEQTAIRTMLQRVLDHSGVPPTLPGTAATDLLPEAAQEVAEVVSEVGLQVALGIAGAHAAPLAPVGLTAAADGRAAIVLSWTAPAQVDTRAAVTGYAIEVSPNGTDAWTPLASVGHATTTWRHGGLSDGVTRYYRVRAASQTGDSRFSNVAHAAIPPAPRPAATLTAEPSRLQQGQSATLQWTSRDATEMDLQPGIGAVPAQGSRSVSPTDSTTYTITVRGAGGSAEATVRVTVTSPPSPQGRIERTGTDGPDDLKGGGGDDLLIGRKGRDMLRGLGGHDDLRGGGGQDQLLGGPGNDELAGGKGDDTYSGGPGADRFVFSLRAPGDNIITDFDAGEGDRIVLRTDSRAKSWRSIADIIATAVAQGDRFMVYTLFAGLTVETDVPLRAADFVVEAP